MPIVGGLDIHRKQITFGYLDTVTGQVRRGQVSPADREHLRGLAGAVRRPATMPRSRLRGAPGGGMSPRSWPPPASRRMSPSRRTPPSPAAASGTPRPTRPTAGTCGTLLAEGRCRSASSRPATSWNAGRCSSCINDLRREHTAWAQRIHAVLFHQGAPALGEGALRSEQGLAALRESRGRPPVAGRAAAGHHRPGGRPPPWRPDCTSCGTSCCRPPGT